MKKLFIFELLILIIFPQKDTNNILIFNSDDEFNAALKELPKLFMLTYSSHNQKSQQIIAEFEIACTEFSVYQVTCGKISADSGAQVSPILDILWSKLTLITKEKWQQIALKSGLKKGIQEAWLKSLPYRSYKSISTIMMFLLPQQKMMRMVDNQLVDDIPFTYIIEEKLKLKLGYHDRTGVILFKSYDEGRLDYPFNTEDILSLKTFIEENRYPIILPLDRAHYNEIMLSKKAIMMLFINENKNQCKEYLEFEKASIDLQGSITMSVADLSNPYAKSLARYYSLDLNQIPKMMIFYQTHQELDTHVLQGQINEARILEFYEDYKSGHLEQVIKSEEVPLQQYGPLMKIVGLTFEKIVLDKTKDVLVMFTAENCGNCKLGLQEMMKVASHFKKNDHVIIGEFDARQNSLPDNQIINSLPSFIFYPCNQKQKPYLLKSNKKVKEEQLIKFIKTQQCSKKQIKEKIMQSKGTYGIRTDL